MHRSRLAGFIIDTHESADLEDGARFWSAALGMTNLGEDGAQYRRLDASARDLVIEVQRVGHPSRLHLDLESDDIDAEAARLEALGATRVELGRNWWVMQAPTGHRFCIVRAKIDLAGKPGVTEWP